MRQFLRPRWIVAHVFVLAVCVGCVIAGFWQLDRLAERRLSNSVQAARFQQEPLPIEDLVAAAGEDLDSLEYRWAEATGRFIPDEELLVRSQVYQGRAGFDIVTPLVLDDGTAVVVNRGWVPLEFDTAPVTAAPPPAGTVTVEAVVRVPADRPSGDTQTSTLSRVDVEAFRSRSDRSFLPVYLEIVGSGDSTTIPVPEPPPDFTDEGPHLSYAVQWFSFAIVGVVGYGFLLRRSLRRSGRDSEIVDDFDARKPDEIGSGQADLGTPGSGADHD